MRGLKTDRTASVVIAGHAFIQNLRRGHYELGTDTSSMGRLAAAFDELAPAILRVKSLDQGSARPSIGQRNSAIRIASQCEGVSCSDAGK